LTHKYHYGHFVPLGLHLDVLVEDACIGIPGQKKLYRAELSNFNLWPVKLTACDFITDTLQPETEYPYAVERWDVSSNTWSTVVQMDSESFCRPYPTGMSHTRVVTKLLWPCMSVLVMRGEATGARVPFRKGDLARFVVFRSLSGVEWQTAVASKPFEIEEDVIRDEQDSFRVKH